MTEKLYDPIHPGEILLEDFIKPFGITPTKLATDLDIPSGRVDDIVRGERAITADTALRLERYFNLEAQFWMNLQNTYDLEVAQDCVGDEVSRIVPLAAR